MHHVEAGVCARVMYPQKSTRMPPQSVKTSTRLRKIFWLSTLDRNIINIYIEIESWHSLDRNNKSVVEQTVPLDVYCRGLAPQKSYFEYEETELIDIGGNLSSPCLTMRYTNNHTRWIEQWHFQHLLYTAVNGHSTGLKAPCESWDIYLPDSATVWSIKNE